MLSNIKDISTFIFITTLTLLVVFSSLTFSNVVKISLTGYNPFPDRTLYIKVTDCILCYNYLESNSEVISISIFLAIKQIIILIFFIVGNFLAYVSHFSISGPFNRLLLHSSIYFLFKVSIENYY
jgi:hypothetical protein